MLIIENGQREIPIIMIKLDYSPACIVSDILNGEFKRNKIITHNNLVSALYFSSKCNLYNKNNLSEIELNKIIKKALKILYNIKGGI